MAEQSTSYPKGANTTHAYFVNTFWTPFLNYVKYIKEKAGNTDVNLDKEIKKEIVELTKFLRQFASIRSNYFRLSAQKYFSKNPTAFIEAYKTALDSIQKNPDYFSNFNVYRYSFDKDDFRTQFFAELLEDTRKLQEVHSIDPKNELNLLKFNLNNCGKILEKRLKTAYVQILARLGEFLTTLNLTEKYGATFKHMLASYFLQDLAYPIHGDEKDTISIDKLFTQDYLNTLNLPKLMALSAFWTNRVTKDLIKLNELLYIVNELDLWENVKNEKKHFDIDENKLNAILAKTQYLSALEISIFNKVESQQYDNPNLTQDEINNIFEAKFNQEVKQLEVQYKVRFGKLLPDASNNLDDDLSALHSITNAQYLLYRLKDTCLFSLLMGSIDNHYSKNWGIILDSESENKFVNISFDIEGLNMPLRLHINRNELKNFFKAYTGDPIIPIYKGYNDMIIYDRYISTTVLAPICKKQSTFLTNKLADTAKLPPDIVSFLRHIKFLKNNSNMPPALKSGNPNAPNALNLETSEKLHISSKELFK